MRTKIKNKLRTNLRIKHISPILNNHLRLAEKENQILIKKGSLNIHIHCTTLISNFFNFENLGKVGP